jgi:hypothetical protein
VAHTPSLRAGRLPRPVPIQSGRFRSGRPGCRCGARRAFGQAPSAANAPTPAPARRTSTSLKEKSATTKPATTTSAPATTLGASAAGSARTGPRCPCPSPTAGGPDVKCGDGFGCPTCRFHTWGFWSCRSPVILIRPDRWGPIQLRPSHRTTNCSMANPSDVPPPFW